MPRGIPWDDLPNIYEKRKVEPASSNKDVEKIEKFRAERDSQPLDIIKDANSIGKRIAFGIICGSMTGACFGFVEVLRTPKLLTSQSSEATKRVIKSTSQFAAFFGAYHGLRKILHLYVPTSMETNLMTAACLSLAPFATIPKLRPLLPYGVIMVGLDSINGLYDL